MTICSLGFLLFCGGLTLVFQIALVKWLRQILLACGSAVFLASLVPDRRSWTWFIVTLGATYVALILVRARPHGGVVAIASALIYLVYLYLKKYTLLADFIPFPYEWDLSLHRVELVGLSYMTFKFIHLLVDQWGNSPPFNLWTYLNY
jgi:hypothetical protein